MSGDFLEGRSVNPYTVRTSVETMRNEAGWLNRRAQEWRLHYATEFHSGDCERISKIAREVKALAAELDALAVGLELAYATQAEFRDDPTGMR